MRQGSAILSSVNHRPILLGTSSFTATGWLGSFYPKGTRSADFLTFYAEVVYERDKFERQYAPKRNLFRAPADGDRGEEIGAYALVEFKDGTVDWEFCDKALIERHRKHSKQPDSLMWSKFHEEA